MDNFDLKKFLVENKITKQSQLSEIMMYSPQRGGVDQDWDDAARRAAEKEKKRKADLGDEEYARVKGEETLSFSIIQAKRAAKALGKDISKEIEDIKTKHSGNTAKQKEAVKRLYSKLNKERINK